MSESYDSSREVEYREVEYREVEYSSNTYRYREVEYIEMLNHYENIISNFKNNCNFLNTDPLYNTIQLKRAKMKQIEILSHLEQLRTHQKQLQQKI